jgi:hypothetical protein
MGGFEHGNSFRGQGEQGVKGAHRKNDRVFRAEGIAARGAFFVEKLNRHPGSPEIFFKKFRPLLYRETSIREIYVKDVSERIIF